MSGPGDRLRQLFGIRGAAVVPPPTPTAQVVPDAARCVQCGVCGYNCPVGISVRDYARQGLVVDDPRCVQCGQCVAVCPRGTLRWVSVQLLTPDAEAAEYAELMRVFSGGGPAA